MQYKNCIIAEQSASINQCKLEIEPPAVITKRIRPNLPVTLGAFSMIHGPGTVCWIEIGRYCSIAPNVVLGGNEHAINWVSTASVFENAEIFDWHKNFEAKLLDAPHRGMPFPQAINKITIGHDVWIGDGSFIRNGVNIGTGSVIGAHSVVVSDVPEYSVVVGNPGRIIRSRFTDDIIERMLKSQWWKYSYLDLYKIDFTNPAKALDELADLEELKMIFPYNPMKILGSDFCAEQ
jgi:acetyltransferase-like isoleucine patch superfamily enzyme